MRFMIIARPAFPIPPDLMIGLLDGFGAWWEQYKDRWDGGFFAGGTGGGGVCTVADEVELNQMMMEWPLFGFSAIESHAILDVETALDHWRTSFSTMMEQMGTS